MARAYHFVLALVAVSVVAWVACTGGRTINAYAVYTGGDPQQGKQLIVQYRCGACHVIPGVRGAHGLVGPPLMFFGRRTMIAGELPNTPANLEKWLRSPQSVEPGTAMPELGLTEEQARAVAAYLYTLR